MRYSKLVTKLGTKYICGILTENFFGERLSGGMWRWDKGRSGTGTFIEKDFVELDRARNNARDLIR
jgi:hypothetical protein